METEKKKHKGGYDLLKEKYAKLENELAQADSAKNNYSAQLDRSKTDVHNLNIEVKELKEKLAKADAKNAELQKEKEILVQTAQDNYCRVEKERDELKEKLSLQIAPDFEDFKRVERKLDEWKAKYAVKTSELERTLHGQAISIRGLAMDNTELSKKVAFLLDHCPFWVRWMYRRRFEKGGN